MLDAQTSERLPPRQSMEDNNSRAPKTSPLVGRKALVGAPIEPASPLFSERGVTPPWVAPTPTTPSRHEVSHSFSRRIHPYGARRR